MSTLSDVGQKLNVPTIDFLSQIFLYKDRSISILGFLLTKVNTFELSIRLIEMVSKELFQIPNHEKKTKWLYRFDLPICTPSLLSTRFHGSVIVNTNVW